MLANVQKYDHVSTPSPAEFGHLQWQNDEIWECSIASPKAKMGSQLVVGDLSGDIVELPKGGQRATPKNPQDFNNTVTSFRSWEKHVLGSGLPIISFTGHAQL